MNLATEYILRDNKVEKLLFLPCSLFLYNNDSKMIVTLNKHYGRQEMVLVKHWLLDKDSSQRKFPPCCEYVIKRDAIFTDKKVVIPEYCLLSFTEEPFMIGDKQYADGSYSTLQDSEYKTCLENFYNTKEHNNNRLNWLWTEFNKYHVPEDMKWKYGQDSARGKTIQREIVQFYNKGVWRRWTLWKNLFLDFNSWIAPELVFYNAYLRSCPDQPSITSVKPSKRIWDDNHFYQPALWAGIYS